MTRFLPLAAAGLCALLTGAGPVAAQETIILRVAPAEAEPERKVLRVSPERRLRRRDPQPTPPAQPGSGPQQAFIAQPQEPICPPEGAIYATVPGHSGFIPNCAPTNTRPKG